jgi:MFS family permease
LKAAHAHHRAALLSRRRRWLTFAVLAGLWGTGVAWLVLRYGMQHQGEFGPSPHPLQPWALRIHALFAFTALWLGGMLWAVHIVPTWRRGHRRASGILTIASLLLLAASGYLLYYIGDDRWRVSVSMLHWILGLFAIVPFLVHLLNDRRHRVQQRHRQERGS